VHGALDRAVASAINRDVRAQAELDVAGRLVFVAAQVALDAADRLELVAVALAASIPADDLTGASAVNRDVRAQA
jgi:hypothetical protein